MTRTLAGFGIALALVGSAHAQDQNITVSLVGKSHAAVRETVYRAAQKVCAPQSDALTSVDTACIEATYAEAMRQLRSTPHAERIAYQIDTSAQ